MSAFKRYKSKPKEIKAVQFTNTDKNKIFNELTGQHAADFENGEPILKITTVHGETAIVRIGDWIVKDLKIGTYYPVKNEYFMENYQLEESK